MPSLTADELKIVNRSLARIGASQVEDIAEDSEINAKVAAIWQDTKEFCLAAHSTWVFASKTYRLNRRPAAPENGWRYAFDFPGGVLGAPEIVYRDIASGTDPLRRFELEEGLLFADQEIIHARFPVEPAPSLWSPLFRLAVTVGTAGELAVPVSHDKDLAARLLEEAFGRPEERRKGGLLGLAIADDMSKHTVASPLLRDDPLTLARYG